MKVWKSPVFHFGILLVVAVTGLLLAPFIIDWNGYRSDLESFGKKLTGRAVTIDGQISARMFPWPRLTAEKVTVANPPGLERPYFATAERVVIRMTLAGLLQGGIDVESIDVDQPAVDLERRATGEGNWIFTPSADLLRSDVLSRVRLDQIRLADGTIRFRDRRRGETVTLEDFTANVASPVVAGPWRMRAQSLYNGRAIDLSVNTAAYAEGEPFRFGVKVSAADGSGYAFGFDGAMKDGKADGQVRIEPAAAGTGDGKTDAEGRIRPLLFTAKVKGDFDAIDFQDIEVSRLEPGQNGAITTGSAALRLGRQIDASVKLKAPMLDIDALAGAQSRDILRQAGGLGVAESLIALLPKDMSLSGRLEATALRTGGQTLDNVELDIAADHEQLRIARFAAGLPGRSDVLFTGALTEGRSGPELSGTLALETSDLRELTFWLWQAGRARLEQMWSGSRGRLKLQTDISLTASQLQMGSAEFELDGERGKGSLSLTSAGRGAIDLALEGGRFDLDSYAPQGIPALSVASQGGAAGLMALALPKPDAPDLKLRFTAGELLLNAVTARDVSLDLQAGANGLDLRGLNIGSVGGAKLEATGLILDTGKGADGTIGLTVEAGDPSELIRLMGLGASDGLPAWATDLGETEVRASLAVKPKDSGSEIFFKASGTAGDLSIAGQGTASPDSNLSGTLAVTAPSSARILALLGVSAAQPGTEPGALRFEAAGTAAEGFKANATLQVMGGRLAYEGNIHPWTEGLGLDGQVSLKAGDAGGLFAVSGLPAPAAPGAVSAEAKLSWADGKWTLANITGSFGSQDFSGSASLTPALVADLRISTGPLRLRDVLAATFLEWSGPVADPETGFAAALPLGLTGQLWFTPSSLEVVPHFTVGGAEIGIAAKPGELQLSMFGKDKDGRGAQIEITSQGNEASRKLSGHLNLPLDLSQQLKLAAGTPVASGMGTMDLRFTSEGRSPAAALAAMDGEGTYKIAGFQLVELTPAAFAQALAGATDAASIGGVFDALRGGAGLAFGDVAGKIAVRDGQMAFDPVTHQDESADVEVKTLADLALGQIDIDAGLKLKARDGLPPMSVSYAGPPRALTRSEDITELATVLGVTIMQQGINELERLQQEQQRLAKLEEEQRIVDEARLQAYYAQRDELLLRRRELKVQAEMQVAEADRLRRQIESERAANAEINKAETRQRLRELRVWRRLAKLAEKPKTVVADEPAIAPPPVSAKPVAPPAPRPVRVRPPAQNPPPVIAPRILARPPGAPVIISAPPGSSPSQ